MEIDGVFIRRRAICHPSGSVLQEMFWLWEASKQRSVQCCLPAKRPLSNQVADVLEGCGLITGRCLDNLVVVSQFLMRVPSLAISSVTSILWPRRKMKQNIHF